MSHYLADLVIVFKTAGWMLAVFALPLGLWVGVCAAIKSVGPQRRQAPGAQERTYL